MARLTGAEMVAQLFEGYGVSHVFFVPTILNHALYQMEQQTGVKRIVTHAEKSAAYMADGYARASRRPGICMAQTVGAANLAAGLRDAFMACSPVIAITGGPYRHSRDRYQYQEVEDLPFFKPVTKASTRVDDVARIPQVIGQMFRSATTGRPGPVHVEFEGHQGEVLERQSADADMTVEQRFARLPPFRPAPEDDDVRRTARLLQNAARPVIVAGGGVRQSQAQAQLVNLAERLSIPVVTSLTGKDVIPSDHPLAAGVVGLYSRETANRVVAEADLVFFVGSRTGSQVTHSWRLPPAGTTVIQCDISADVAGVNYHNTASLVGDARRSLELLLAAVGEGTGPDRSAWVSRVRGLVGEWRSAYRPLLESDAVPLRPERLCKEVSDLLPPDAVLVSDTGHAGMWTGGMVDLRSPGHGYLRAAGSLGWAFPAALGAKCALPDRPVVAFTGDGGFWYHIAELETAVRWNIAVVIVVNNNSAFNQEIGLWTEAYGGHLHGRHSEMWRFRDVSFAAIARDIGADGIRIERPQDLRGGLEKAFTTERPAVVEVVTDVDAVAPMAFTPARDGELAAG